MRKPWLFILLLGAFAMQGQDSLQALVKAPELSVQDLQNIVQEHHPLARQARLIQFRAEAKRLKAGGAFDPKLFSEVEQKYFDEKNYYQLQNSGLEIPAWFGLSAKTGYELNEGLFLNNQNTVPGSGLWYADVSWTLGRGLWLDERRAALKQARLMEDAALFEVQAALNQLVLEATESYWQWYAAERRAQVYEQALETARIRLEAVRRTAVIGDRPLIDTLEAHIQMQDRRLKLRKAQADRIEARNRLATFLWYQGRIPLQLAPQTQAFFTEPQGVLLPQEWLENHPQLRAYDFKLDIIDVEQSLNRQAVLPQLDVHYKFLTAPTQNDIFAQYALNNYQWGLTASFPLFLRKERAEIRLTDAKQQSVSFQRDLKALELENEVQALQQKFLLSNQQWEEAQSLVLNYQRLLRAENRKFENGESSLFLVNRRELKYLENQEKQIELAQEVQSVRAKLLAKAGVLVELEE